MHKIAIAGASTLLGKELKEALADSQFAAATLVLLDEGEGLGQLDQVGDEVTFVQALSPDAFDGVDFAFFCGTEALTARHWRKALTAGAMVLDLSGALDQEAGVLVRAPWIAGEAADADLATPAVVPAHAAAVALALVMERVRLAAPVRSASATVLLPASEFGRAAMDELHQQTVNLLSFQPLPKAVYDAQAAYNLLTGLGESATVKLAETGARIRRHVTALMGRKGALPAVQVIAAPVFHGHAFSIAVELERAVEISALEEALSGEHVDLVLEDTDSPSNLAATGQNDVLVRMRVEPGERNPNEARRLWLWATSDNLRMAAQIALDCALDLRRLRPQGTVQ